MSVSRQVRLLAITSAIGLALALSVGSGVAIADHDDSPKLEGSWMITITGTPFKILRTFTDGGVVDAYAFPPITPTPGPLINSGGHGNWKKIGPRTFAVTVKYFQLNPQLNSTFQILDSLGTVRETVVLSKDGQSYTSVFQTVVELSGGGIIPNAGATTATRINVEPLP